jgi:hypothetical protein
VYVIICGGVALAPYKTTDADQRARSGAHQSF